MATNNGLPIPSEPPTGITIDFKLLADKHNEGLPPDPAYIFGGFRVFEEADPPGIYTDNDYP